VATSRINKLCPSCQTRVHLTDAQYKSFLRTLSLVVPCPSCGLAVSFSEMSEPDLPPAAPVPPSPLLGNSAPVVPAVPVAVPPPFSPIAAPPFARMGAASGDRSPTISADEFARIPRQSNVLLRPLPPKPTLGDRWEALSGPGQWAIVLILIALVGGAIFGLVPSLGEPAPRPPAVQLPPEDKPPVPTKPAPPAKKPEVKKPTLPPVVEAELVAPRLVEPEAELVVPREKADE